MANPPIRSIDFTTGKAVLRTATQTFTFPIEGLPANAVLPPLVLDPGKSLDNLGALINSRLDKLQGLLLDLAAAGAIGPAAPPAAPTKALTLGGLSALVAGGSIKLEDGTYTGALHIGVPQTISGAGMRKTVLDGQMGVGGGHRLSYGKGILHIGAPATIQDIGFINGGGGDGTSDAEAGVYVEGFEGTVLLLRCAFDGCENGVFMPGIDLARVDLILDYCVFGRRKKNGLPDSLSHNVYVSGKSVTILHGIFLETEGNDIKCRTPLLRVEDSYVRGLGRFIDLPGGTVATSSRNTYVMPPGQGSSNDFGFYDESDVRANPGSFGSFVSTDDTFYFSRWKEVIWVNNEKTPVQFIRPNVKWVGPPGGTPPIIEIRGPGGIQGENPFVFSEANRVDAAPDAPADPVA